MQSGSSVDVVGVFTQNFSQIFSEARPIKATIRETSRTMEHPVETGVITTDHRIIMPTEIDLSMVLNSIDYPDVYKQIKSYWLRGTLLTVQTRVAVYMNQLISEIPHEESPEQFDMITLALKLKQVQIVTAKYGIIPRAPKNSTTVPTGAQVPQPSGAALQPSSAGIPISPRPAP